MNTSAVNSGAIAAALHEDGPGNSNRRSWNLKTSSSRGVDSNRDVSSGGDRHSLSRVLRADEISTRDAIDDESAVADDFLHAEHVGSTSSLCTSKTKARRASEGSYLTKGEGKRSSGELRCEKCGKGYKHSSCLTKHLSVPSDPSVLQLSVPFLLHIATLVSLTMPAASVVLCHHGHGLFG